VHALALAETFAFFYLCLVQNTSSLFGITCWPLTISRTCDHAHRLPILIKRHFKWRHSPGLLLRFPWKSLLKNRVAAHPCQKGIEANTNTRTSSMWKYSLMVALPSLPSMHTYTKSAQSGGRPLSTYFWLSRPRPPAGVRAACAQAQKQRQHGCEYTRTKHAQFLQVLGCPCLGHPQACELHLRTHTNAHTQAHARAHTHGHT